MVKYSKDFTLLSEMMLVQLRFIEKNTVFHIRETSSNQELNNKLDSNIYKVTLFDFESDTLFLAEGRELYQNAPNFREDSYVEISFTRGPHLYTFTGKIKDVTYNYGAYLSLIEQLSSIVVSNRRAEPRNDISTNIKLYELSENNLNNLSFAKASRKNAVSATSLDISSRGICVVSNNSLNLTLGAYFLLEFTLETNENKNSHFILPAMLIRAGTCPQTTAYDYDYGFIFHFDSIPEEKENLVMALFNARLAAFKRL